MATTRSNTPVRGRGTKRATSEGPAQTGNAAAQQRDTPSPDRRETAPGPFSRTYITPEGAKAARAYKYKGGDKSLVYKYVLSPFADYLVHNWTPEWMA